MIFYHKYTRTLPFLNTVWVPGIKYRIKKIDYFMHIFAMKKTGVKPTSINRNKIVYFKAILSLVKVDSNKIGF